MNNKKTLFLLGEKTPEILKIADILNKAELSFEYATAKGELVTSETKGNVDRMTDFDKDSIVYIDCSEEIPSFEYAIFLGEPNIYKQGLMEQFLNLLYLNEMFKAGIVKYNPGSQSNVLGRVIKASVLIDGEREWLIDYMDFCAVSPIPEDVKIFL